MKYRLSSLLLFGLMLAAAPAFAQGIIHDEAVAGDLSDSGTAPMGFTLGTGVNTIQGSLGPSTGGNGASNNTSDADFFTFTLGAGQTVTSISTTRTGTGAGSFLGYSNSASIAGINSSLTGGSLFSNGALSGGISGGGVTLSAVPVPLGAGDHTFILQETGAAIDYSISFTVAQAVPEPSSAALLGGLALVGFIRRRRR